MTQIFGHVAVSASFDPTARLAGRLAYEVELERLRQADADGLYQACAFALAPDAPQDCAELCATMDQLGFVHKRGIISGVELCDAAQGDAARRGLLRHFELAVSLGIHQVFCVAEQWPAGDRQADFEADILPAFVEHVGFALREVPEIVECGVEPLIPVEQQHVNTLAKARQLAQLTNEKLGEQRVFPVPDLAHLYGLVPRAQWPAITAELEEAVAGGEVPYAHLSVPESRTDRVVAAIQAGDLPEDAVRALRGVAHVDQEAFDPQDRFLDALRERVPKFAAADPSGWTEDLRFGRFIETARYFKGLG